MDELGSDAVAGQLYDPDRLGQHVCEFTAAGFSDFAELRAEAANPARTVVNWSERWAEWHHCGSEARAELTPLLGSSCGAYGGDQADLSSEAAIWLHLAWGPGSGAASSSDYRSIPVGVSKSQGGRTTNQVK